MSYTDNQVERIKQLSVALGGDGRLESFLPLLASLDERKSVVISFLALTGRYPTSRDIGDFSLFIPYGGIENVFRKIHSEREDSDVTLDIRSGGIFYDLTHTIGYGWLSGIQRVVREVGLVLRKRDGFSCFVFKGAGFYLLNEIDEERFFSSEEEMVRSIDAGMSAQRFRTRVKNFLFSILPPFLFRCVSKVYRIYLVKRGRYAQQRDETEPVFVPIGGRIICAELLEVSRGEHYEALLSLVDDSGAILYDVIPLTHPHFCDPGIVLNHTFYMQALAKFKHLWPISVTAAMEARKLANLESCEVKPVLLPALENGGEQMVSRGEKPDSKQFVYVSTLDPRKNHLRFLLACEELWKRDFVFSVRFIGGAGWQNESLLKLISDLQEKGRELVFERRFVSDEEVKECIRSAWYSIFVSETEGYGLPIVESLREGCPVICSNFGSMKEIADVCGGCLLVDSLNVRSLLEVLEKSLMDEELRERLLESIDCNQLGDWNSYVEQILDEKTCS